MSRAPPDRPRIHVHRHPYLPLCALVETVHAGCQCALGSHQPGRFPPEILEERKREAEFKRGISEITEFPTLEPTQAQFLPVSVSTLCHVSL